MPERTNGSQPLLPLVSKQKEDKSKEEAHKLLDGNSVETLDWVSTFNMLIVSLICSIDRIYFGSELQLIASHTVSHS